MSRLAPKVTVAITTTMASAVPTMAERTGTVVAARPRGRGRTGPPRPPARGARRHRATRITFDCWARPRRVPSRSDGAPVGTPSPPPAPVRTTTRTASPRPSTVQSKATPRSGYTGRTTPIGASGERARWRPPPPARRRGPRRRPRRRGRPPWSSPDRRRGLASAPFGAPKRSCRPMASPAISSAASAAMPPKTPRAIDSGLMARSATAVLGASSEVRRPLGPANVVDLPLHHLHVPAAMIECKGARRAR